MTTYELQYFIDGEWRGDGKRWERLSDATWYANFNMAKARVVAHINDVDSLRSQGKVEQRVVMMRENNFAWERVNA